MSERELNVAAEVGAARALHPQGDGRPAPVGSDEQLLRRSLERRVAELERELAQALAREKIWSAERSRLIAALAEAEREVAELPATRYERDVTRDTAYWLAVVQSSWSWKLTGPLRGVARLARRARRGRPVS